MFRMILKLKTVVNNDDDHTNSCPDLRGPAGFVPNYSYCWLLAMIVLPGVENSFLDSNNYIAHHCSTSTVTSKLLNW